MYSYQYYKPSQSVKMVLYWLTDISFENHFINAESFPRK